MALAIIPARGGSKRIPRKNIREFHGKPMIAYPISAARDSGCFDRILVSTDDEEIANIAIAEGAEAPFLRPADLSDDFTPLRPVINHAIEWIGQDGMSPRFVCAILPTAPFLNAETLADAHHKLRETGRDFVFSAASYEYPIMRSFRMKDDGRPEWIWPQHRLARSQDLEAAYHDAGQFYWGRREAFLSGVDAISSDSYVYQLSRHLVHDIDTEEDWVRAELAFNALKSR